MVEVHSSVHVGSELRVSHVSHALAFAFIFAYLGIPIYLFGLVDADRGGGAIVLGDPHHAKRRAKPKPEPEAFFGRISHRHWLLTRP